MIATGTAHRYPRYFVRELADNIGQFEIVDSSDLDGPAIATCTDRSNAGMIVQALHDRKRYDGMKRKLVALADLANTAISKFEVD